MAKNMKLKLGLIILLFITNSCYKNQEYLEVDGDWRVTHILYDNKEILGNKLSDNNKWNIPLYKTKVFYIDLPSKQWVLYIDGDDKEPTRGKFEIVKNKFQNYLKFYNSSDSKFDGLYHKKIEYDTIQAVYKKAIYLMTLQSEKMKIM